MVDVIITEHYYKIPSKRVPACLPAERLLGAANTPGAASGPVFDSNWICSIRDEDEPQRVTAESIAGNFMTALLEFEVLFLFAANFLVASRVGSSRRIGDGHQQISLDNILYQSDRPSSCSLSGFLPSRNLIRLFVC